MTYTPENPWIPTSTEDWTLAAERGRNWAQEPRYRCWYADPRVSMTPAQWYTEHPEDRPEQTYQQPIKEPRRRRKKTEPEYTTRFEETQ